MNKIFTIIGACGILVASFLTISFLLFSNETNYTLGHCADNSTNCGSSPSGRATTHPFSAICQDNSTNCGSSPSGRAINRPSMHEEVNHQNTQPTKNNANQRHHAPCFIPPKFLGGIGHYGDCPYSNLRHDKLIFEFTSIYKRDPIQGNCDGKAHLVVQVSLEDSQKQVIGSVQQLDLADGTNTLNQGFYPIEQKIVYDSFRRDGFIAITMFGRDGDGTDCKYFGDASRPFYEYSINDLLSSDKNLLITYNPDQPLNWPGPEYDPLNPKAGVGQQPSYEIGTRTTISS